MLRSIQRLLCSESLLTLALLVLLAACNSNKSPEKPSLRSFASPDDAGSALVEAVKSGDQNALLGIFGPDSKDVIFSGDAAQDKATADKFVTAYNAMHRWRILGDGMQALLVGADNFTFPIPIKQNAAGQWSYDTAAGRNEILARRVGRNELAIIDVAGAVADAQTQYFSHPRDGVKQYAAKFISDPGKQNGLYWEPVAGQPKSPLGPLVAFATSEGYAVKQDSHVPFHGYYFRLLNKQGSNAQGGAKDYIVNGKMTGGWAFIAYPAEYGNSGIMTFMINQDGVLLEKDLGKTTVETATAMTEFDPDSSWRRVVPQ